MSIRDDPDAQIGTDGIIALSSAKEIFHMDFNLISNVEAIRLDVIKTDSEKYSDGILLYRRVELDEIVPKFQQSKSTMYLSNVS